MTPKQKREWTSPGHAEAIRASKGENIIGNEAGLTTLYRVRVGRGQLIYVGWEIASSIPPGRSPSTVEQEEASAAQVRVLLNIVDDLIPTKAK